MTADRYQANIITKTKVDPANNYESTAAPGVWSLDEALAFQKAGKWPAPGNAPLSIEDVFSVDLYDGNGDSQVISNGINLGQSNSGGSVRFKNTQGYVRIEDSTNFDIGSSTDYTIEMFVFFLSDPNNGNVKYLYDGKASTGTGGSTNFLAQESSNDWSIDGMIGTAFSSSDFTEGQWYHIAITRSSGTIRSFKDGTLVNSASNSTATDTDQFTIGARYSDSITGSITYGLTDALISNFRFVNGTALYTSNFTVPTAELTAVTNTALLTCQGDSPLTDNSTNANTVNGEGLAVASEVGPFTATDAGSGGMVFFKNRNSNTSYKLFDTERGAFYKLHTDENIASTQETDTLKSFNSTGFTVLGDGAVNGNNGDLSSFTFRKAENFFTVVTYTGTGPGSGANEQQVSHDLGVKPGVVLIKATSQTGDWWFFTDVIDGSNDYAYLNADNAFASSSNNVATDSVFNVGGVLNTSGVSYIAYLFANHDGDGTFGPTANQDIIKCGTFTGSVGNFVNLGFEPQWVLAKNTAASEDWYIIDVFRGSVRNTNSSGLLSPNTYTTEVRSGNGFEMLPGGFNAFNGGGATYFYMAIRRGPMKTPVSATEVFDVTSYSGNNGNNLIYSGWPADLEIVGPRTEVRSWKFGVASRLQGRANYIPSSSTDAEQTDGPPTQWESTEGTLRSSTAMNSSADSPIISWMWQRRAGFCEALTYTGTGSNRTISHGLEVAPEMMWIRSRTSGGYDWMVYHKDLGNTKMLKLNETGGPLTRTGLLNNTSPTDSVFTVGTDALTNDSGTPYVSYHFASLPGISKIGSYTGDGTTDGSNIIECGFSPRFLIIKRYDSIGGWLVLDTVRGLTSGDDNYLRLNQTDAELSLDLVDPTSTGFAVVNTSSTNINNATYIFYAIAP